MTVQGWQSVADLTNETYIDSRDIIEWMDAFDGDDEDTTDEERELYAAMVQLSEEGIEDWEYGAQFIRDDAFEDYARELAEDCGMVPDGLAWPLTCIDWKKAARELRMDYTAVEIGRETYWVR